MIGMNFYYVTLQKKSQHKCSREDKFSLKLPNKENFVHIKFRDHGPQKKKKADPYLTNSKSFPLSFGPKYVFLSLRACSLFRASASCSVKYQAKFKKKKKAKRAILLAVSEKVETD